VTWSNSASGGSGTATGTTTWGAAIPLTPGTNLITITVTDQAGNQSTTVFVIVHDTQAPTITISTPTSAASYNSPTTPLLVGGNASDNVGVTSVTWSNSATGAGGVAVGTDSWSASIALVEGSNQITVTAMDAVGNTSSDVITVSHDPTLPTIGITSPTAAPTYSTTTNPLDISGTASDNIGLTSVTWANTTTGTTGTAVGTSVWTASIPLASGPNVVVVTASDGVGNTATDTLTVTYDITPPTVVIVSPAPPTLTTQTRPLAISGTATDNVGVIGVTWSNNLTGTNGSADFTDPAWSASIPLIPGINLITIRATDALGNIGSATLSVDYSHETVAPSIVIDTPTTGPTFTSVAQSVTVAGTAADNVGVVSVTWKNMATGVTGIAFGTTAWNAQIPLAIGANLINVTALDDVGNSIQASITISYTATPETTAPTISITAPTSADTFTTTVSPLYLECDAVDDTGVVVVQWSNQGTFGDGVSSWGTTWYSSIPLVKGTNLIQVIAIDPFGNTSTDTITVTYNPPNGDPIPPGVTITSPAASGTVNVSVPTISIAGTASDNDMVSQVTFSNSPSAAFGDANGTTTWAVNSIALDPGVNVITARAFDPAGNVGQTTLVVVYTPPAAAKPVAPVIPAGMCGCTGLEVLLGLGVVWLRRRRRGA
jgi:hypothetical protein